MIEILPLHWIAPPDDGSGMGQEDCLIQANGMGGKYAISTKQSVRLPCGEGYLLWDVEDPFIFTEHETIEAAQAHAQTDHEKRIQEATRDIETGERLHEGVFAHVTVEDAEQAAAFLAALRDERDYWQTEAKGETAKLEYRDKIIERRETRMRELEQKLEQARVALEPFAREGSKLTPDLDKYSWLNTGLSNANFRHAHATLAEIGPSNG